MASASTFFSTFLQRHLLLSQLPLQLQIAPVTGPVLWRRAASLTEILLEGKWSSLGKCIVPSGSISPGE